MNYITSSVTQLIISCLFLYSHVFVNPLLEFLNKSFYVTYYTYSSRLSPRRSQPRLKDQASLSLEKDHVELIYVESRYKRFKIRYIAGTLE